VVTECKFDGIISGPAKVVDEYLREQKTGNCE
jgi:hypothetical protein